MERASALVSRVKENGNPSQGGRPKAAVHSPAAEAVSYTQQSVCNAAAVAAL